jgi:hypothetical protein
MSPRDYNRLPSNPALEPTRGYESFYLLSETF